MFPRMHATPTDFAFSGKAFTMGCSHDAGFAESLSGFFSIASGVFSPIGRPASSINTNDAVFSNPVIVKNTSDSACFFNSEDKFCPLIRAAKRRITNSAWPNWSYNRTNIQAFACDFVCHLFNIVSAGIRVGVGMKKKEINSIELLPIYLSFYRKIQHVI